MGEGGKDIKSEDLFERLAEELVERYLGFRSRLVGIGDVSLRFAWFIGFLNEWFMEKKLGFIVVTGGFAVELLTGRAYRTMDVDLITSNPRVARVLEIFLGRISERIARGYLPIYDEIAVKSIDIVSTAYTRDKPPVKIIVDDKTVFVDPPEELIVAYLAAWKYWDSTLDRDKALWLLIVLRDKLDMDYLWRRARRENVEDKLEDIYRIANSA